MKDLAENGLTDLFEYGQEFMVGGNALGPGTTKDENKTDTQEASFAEKYRKELKKDILDEDEEEEEEADTGDETKEETEDDGGEEEVSSKDMFDEM